MNVLDTERSPDKQNKQRNHKFIKLYMMKKLSILNTFVLYTFIYRKKPLK